MTLVSYIRQSGPAHLTQILLPSLYLFAVVSAIAASHDGTTGAASVSGIMLVLALVNVDLVTCVAAAVTCSSV